MNGNRYVIEFRSGSFFKCPRPDRGGTIAQAMRFNQAKHAAVYLDRKASWAWFNGAMVMLAPLDNTQGQPHRTRRR